MNGRDQRYYASSYGRFNTADQYQASAGPGDPGSWNRYAYVNGDPVNYNDPQGLMAKEACTFDASSRDGSCDDNSGYLIGGVYSPDCTSAGSNAYVNATATYNCGGQTWFTYPVQYSEPQKPTCEQVLTADVQSFLQTNDAALLQWDPNLAVDFVSVGEQDGVDPRLMASIATLESGHGSVFGGNNNPFGLGPKWNFSTPLAAVKSQGITLKHLIGYGDNSVSTLYSGLKGIANGSHGFAQVPGYCQTSVAACQAAGNTVAGFLKSFTGAPSVGLTAGNPNKLGFPCPE